MRCKKKPVVLTFGLISLFLIGTGTAIGGDGVAEVVEKAMVQYDQQDYDAAVGNLEYASQLIRQERNERMRRLLPSPLEGWLADPVEAQNIGTAVLGEGVNATREYLKEGATITVSVLVGSPVLKSILMMLDNPMFVGAGGGRLEKIGERRAIVTYDPESRSGEVNIVVAEKYVVLIKGQGVERVDLLAYAERINHEAMENKQ
ncbi:MAG: hypothetical protein OEV64_06470 [Desulfobulbaceae bacterium]|nr:hypothetical protein [Desulfobulbaceae bacterium]